MCLSVINYSTLSIETFDHCDNNRILSNISTKQQDLLDQREIKDKWVLGLQIFWPVAEMICTALYHTSRTDLEKSFSMIIKRSSWNDKLNIKIEESCYYKINYETCQHHGRQNLLFWKEQLL